MATQKHVSPPSNAGTRIDSTRALLANNATYTSDGHAVGGFSFVTGICNSDQSGTLSIDQSGDGVNWDYTTSQAVTGGTVVGFSYEIIGGWVRIRFQNTGGSTQTTFRLDTFVRSV